MTAPANRRTVGPARADAALYRAKRTGRDRTVVAGGRDGADVDVLPATG